MARRPAPPPSRRIPIFPVVGAVVIALGVVAILLARGGGDDTTTTTGTGDAALHQTQPVEVTGQALPRFATADGDLAVGGPIPTITGRSFDGEAVSISPDDGPQLIMVVAHWCPHCQREVPLLSPWLQTDLPSGVRAVTVATGTNPNAGNYPPSSWLAANDWPTPVLADDDASSAAFALGVSGYPFFVLVDKDGNVVARTSGEKSLEDVAALVALIAPQ